MEPIVSSHKKGFGFRSEITYRGTIFRGAVYDFTYNNEGKFSASQMCLLFDLPSQDNLDTFRKIKVLAAPPGLHDI